MLIFLGTATAKAEDETDDKTEKSDKGDNTPALAPTKGLSGGVGGAYGGYGGLYGGATGFGGGTGGSNNSNAPAIRPANEQKADPYGTLTGGIGTMSNFSNFYTAKDDKGNTVERTVTTQTNPALRTIGVQDPNNPTPLTITTVKDRIVGGPGDGKGGPDGTTPNPNQAGRTIPDGSAPAPFNPGGAAAVPSDLTPGSIPGGLAVTPEGAPIPAGADAPPGGVPVGDAQNPNGQNTPAGGPNGTGGPRGPGGPGGFDLKDPFSREALQAGPPAAKSEPKYDENGMPITHLPSIRPPETPIEQKEAARRVSGVIPAPNKADPTKLDPDFAFSVSETADAGPSLGKAPPAPEAVAAAASSDASASTPDRIRFSEGSGSGASKTDGSGKTGLASRDSDRGGPLTESFSKEMSSLSKLISEDEKKVAAMKGGGQGEEALMKAGKPTTASFSPKIDVPSLWLKGLATAGNRMVKRAAFLADRLLNGKASRAPASTARFKFPAKSVTAALASKGLAPLVDELFSEQWIFEDTLLMGVAFGMMSTLFLAIWLRRRRRKSGR